MESRQMRAFLTSLAGVYEEKLDYLSQLDAAIADGDHGTSMVRGFRAVKAALEAAPEAAITDDLNTTARVLMKDIGGTCGPLYAMFFMKGAAAIKGAEDFGTSQYADFLTAGMNAMMALGKAQPGGKTMIDALYPASLVLKGAAEKGTPFAEAAAAAAGAAENGRDETAPMAATVGRARYQSDKGVGHIDAGAASMAIFLRTLANCAK